MRGGGAIHISKTFFEGNKFDFGVQVCPDKGKENQKDCSSEISIEDSKYRIRNRTFNTIIRPPSKRITSRKKFLLALWDGSLSDYGYKQVRLNDFQINEKAPPITLEPWNPLDIDGLMASLPEWTSP